MSSSKDISKGRRQGLANAFPTLAELAADAIENPRAAARLETLEILMDVEQVSDLLNSFEDLSKGRIVGMNSAFGDL
jgi:hypothetical protein